MLESDNGHKRRKRILRADGQKLKQRHSRICAIVFHMQTIECQANPFVSDDFMKYFSAVDLLIEQNTIDQ